MAQVLLLKVGTDGIPTEFAAASDEITLVSYTVDGGGPILSSTGLDANNTDVSDVQDLVFTAPTTGTINQTAGAVIIDNLMAKERNNTLTTAGEILFPVVSDTAGQVDNFKVPTIAGAPTATPTNSGSGFMVYDSSGKNLYMWDGTSWDNLNTVATAAALDTPYIADTGGVSIRDAVYISAADKVTPANANVDATANFIGFATSTEIATATVQVRQGGVLTGFSGLSAGALYYLSAATPGAITSSAPTGTGNRIMLAGIAKSTTALNIQMENLGRRA